MFDDTGMGSRFLAPNVKHTQLVMKPIQTTLNAGRLSNEVTLAEAIGLWLRSVNSFCSSLMEETVTNLQVLRVLATFLFLTLAVFTVQRDVLVTVLFLALAAVCSRGIVEEGGES